MHWKTCRPTSGTLQTELAGWRTNPGWDKDRGPTSHTDAWEGWNAGKGWDHTRDTVARKMGTISVGVV
eukprot:10093-Prorocentrum_lima.AAC.1